MTIKQFCKNFILRMDMLSAQPILRSNGQSNFQTFCGGFLSIIIIIAFSIIFYNSFASVIGRLDITYSQTFQDDPTSSSQITSLMIAFGIQGFNFSSTSRTFSVSLFQMNMTSGNSSSRGIIPMSLCNISDWESLGPNFDKQFRGFGFDGMLCINKNHPISLYGYSGSMPYRFLNLQVGLCSNNSIMSGCANSTSSLTAFNSYLTNNASNSIFRASLFIVHTIISPAKSKPISNIIQKNIIITFSQTTGTVGYAYIGDFTIQTDNSILPYTDYTYQSGTFLDTYTSTTIPISSVSSSNLVQFQFYKSTKTLTVTRTYGKIDSLLSYAGGLFSLLFTVIAFFFASYSQYSYQINIGSKQFSLDKNGNRFKQNDFNFFQYVKYCCYDWLCTFGLNPNWQKDKKIHQIRAGANDIMNVSMILHRIRYLENISKILLDQHKLISLYLSIPPTLQESQKLRQSIQFYNELITRIQQNKLNYWKSNQVANSQYLTKQCIEINQITYNSNDIRRNNDYLFNIQNQLDRSFIKALRQLKQQKDKKSNKIKQIIIPQLLDKIPEISTFQKIQIKKSIIDQTMLDFNNSSNI